MNTALNQGYLEQWKAEQFVILRGVIPPESIAACRAMLGSVADGMIQTLKSEGLIDDIGADLPFETRLAKVAGPLANRFGRGWRKAVAQRATFDLHRVPALVDYAQAILGTDVLGHPIFNARPKLPNQQLTVVPWHQDSSYFGDVTAKSLILSAWIPFVDVDETNGCLQIERDSYRRGLLAHRVEALEGGFLEIPPEHVDESKAVTCPMKMGDALLFSNLISHRSLATRSQSIRWSIDVRYLRDGDHPGNAYWGEPGFDWVIRSDTRPETTFDEWMEKTKLFGW